MLFGNVRDFRGKLQECLGLNHLWRINWVIDFVKRSAYGIIYDKPAGLGKNIEMGDLRKKSCPFGFTVDSDSFRVLGLDKIVLTNKFYPRHKHRSGQYSR